MVGLNFLNRDNRGQNSNWPIGEGPCPKANTEAAGAKERPRERARPHGLARLQLRLRG